MADSIKHVWFDVAGTLTKQTAAFHKVHNALRYETYAKAIHKPITDALVAEYEALYSKYGSNSAIFRSLGLPSDYWMTKSSHLHETDYTAPDPTIYETLDTLKDLVPVSLFSNFKLHKIQKILTASTINEKWFTYILTGDDIKERKPALDGFYKIIEKSNLLPENILYVGDRIDVDIRPAKKVGMKTGLVWSQSEDADFSFNTFDEILNLF